MRLSAVQTKFMLPPHIACETSVRVVTIGASIRKKTMKVPPGILSETRADKSKAQTDWDSSDAEIAESHGLGQACKQGASNC